MFHDYKRYITQLTHIKGELQSHLGKMNKNQF